MALIDSVNHGYGTDPYRHYTYNDICLVNNSRVHFYFCSLERTTSVKVLSFLWTLWSFMMHMSFYWIVIELKWSIVQNGH